MLGRLALATAVLATTAGVAGAAEPGPDATPDQLRAYVSSGQYLADVEAAVAPARTALATRMDEIDAQRAACTAAGTPAPAAAAAARPASLFASNRRTGLAAATGGTVRVVVRRAALRRAGVRVRGGRALTLRARTGRLTGTGARADLRGTVVLRRGGTTRTLRALRLRLTRTGATLTARAGGRRVTLARTTRRPARRVVLRRTRAAVTDAPLALTRAGARATGLRRGRLGTLTVRLRATGPATPPASGFTPTAQACAAVPAKPAMVLDIDETALSAYLGSAGGDPGGGTAGQYPELVGTAVALPPVLELYRDARRRGVGVAFVTARIQPQALSTVPNLDREGYGERIGITYRTSTGEDPGVYKRDARKALREQGFSVLLNVGDQCTDLFGGEAEREVKLPNPFYGSDGSKDPDCA